MIQHTFDSNDFPVEPLCPSSLFDFMSILHVLNSGYIERDVDTQLFNGLKETQCCAVFAPPQSGKSSLANHVSAHLMTDDIVCLTIDLAKVTHASQSPDGLRTRSLNDKRGSSDPYGDLILSELWNSITDLPPDHLPFWLSSHPTDTILPQLDQLLEEILLIHCQDRPVVIFVDGLDAHLAHNSSVQELLTLVRRCYNRRPHDPIYQTLTFCLLGDANPAMLVPAQADQSSHNPFPICKFMTPQGFSADQAIEFFPILADVLANPHLAIRLIVQLTGGQPLLTHQLCHLVRTQALTLADPQCFDLNTIPDLVQTHMPDTCHFQRVRDRLLQSGPLFKDCLTRYQQLLLDGDSPTTDLITGLITDNGVDDAVVTELCLAGLVVREGEQLAIANPIYQDMFDRNWLLESCNQYQAGLVQRYSEDVMTPEAVQDWASLFK